MPTSVALSSHFETFVRNQVESGRYNNASEVVRAGLRLLEDQQRQAQLQLDAMQAAIAAGLASGPGIAADQVFDRLEAKYRAQTAIEGTRAARVAALTKGQSVGRPLMGDHELGALEKRLGRTLRPRKRD